jgi:RNA-directed DNA polymerase
MQRKLHHWAVDESDRCFDDLYNLVYDPAFLTLAWERVRTNKGARSAGADGTAPPSVGAAEAVGLLQRLREELKERIFRPDPVREVMIPKANGKLRRLGIATVADRVVQASLKLVLEPIFEADFHPATSEDFYLAIDTERLPLRGEVLVENGQGDIAEQW